MSLLLDPQNKLRKYYSYSNRSYTPSASIVEDPSLFVTTAQAPAVYRESHKFGIKLTLYIRFSSLKIIKRLGIGYL